MIRVNVLRPVVWDDGVTRSTCRCREFPDFMVKAAYRWLRYCQRRWGRANTWLGSPDDEMPF